MKNSIFYFSLLLLAGCFFKKTKYNFVDKKYLPEYQKNDSLRFVSGDSSVVYVVCSYVRTIEEREDFGHDSYKFEFCQAGYIPLKFGNYRISFSQGTMFFLWQSAHPETGLNLEEIYSKRNQLEIGGILYQDHVLLSSFQYGYKGPQSLVTVDYDFKKGIVAYTDSLGKKWTLKNP